MSLFHQTSSVPSIASDDRSIDARIRRLALLSGTLIALVAALALGTGLTMGRQASPSDIALSAESIRWMAILAVVLVSGAAIVLVAVLGRTTAQSVTGTFARTAGLIDRIASGDFVPTLPASRDVAQEAVHQSLRHLVRTLRGNVEAAEALAAGAYRRVAPSRAAADPIGVALGRVAGYMDDMANTAHRIARGDLAGAVTAPATTDTLGQANAAMVRQIVSVMREVEAMKQSIAATTEAMRAEVEALVAGTTQDSAQLRRAADRISQVALQAHANASRATTLEERSVDGATMVRDGVSAVEGSLDALKAVCRRTEVVQELARNAGLVAVSAVAKSSQGDSVGQGLEGMEDEVRQLAKQAAEVTVEISRLTLAGVNAAGESQLILDRMGDSMHESRQLVRELSATAQSHAAELLAIDETVAGVHEVARHNAATARQLASRVESLTSHSRRLDALLRRFQKGGVAATTARAWEMAGPVLYRTPSGSVPRQPRAAVVGR
jgi:methyl-accepting chemotaxis protein